MPILVPNVLDADIFTLQATARDARFTWRRADSKDVPGLVVAGNPSLQYPRDPTDATAVSKARSSIDSKASPDDVDAWAQAAFEWIDYTAEQYEAAKEAWKQLDWGGAVSPDMVSPAGKSLVNGRTFGGLEVLSIGGLEVGTWLGYFQALRGEVASLWDGDGAFTASQAIEVQIAMRGVAWLMQSIAANGDSKSPAGPADICSIARSWHATPQGKCASSSLPSVNGGGGSRWVRVATYAALGVTVGAVGIYAWVYSRLPK